MCTYGVVVERVTIIFNWTCFVFTIAGHSRVEVLIKKYLIDIKVQHSTLFFGAAETTDKLDHETCA